MNTSTLISMTFVAADACPGSLTLPELDVDLSADPDRWVGRCRECGVELALGYAGLVPIHAPPRGADGRQSA